MKADIAARDAAKATIRKAEAELLADEAALARAEVNVAVARAACSSPTARRSGSRPWWATSSSSRPYDGIVVARNANTWDFVLPNTGDPTAQMRAPHLSPERSGRSDLRGRPHGHRPDLRRHPRAGRRLRSYRVRGARQALGLPRRVASGDRDAPLLGPQHQEPDHARRDRPAEPRQPDPAGDVCLRQGRRRATRTSGRCRRPPSPTPAASRSSGGTRTAARGAPKSRRASSDGEWIEVTNRRVTSSKLGRRGEVDADRPLGSGALGQQAVDPHRRRRGAAGRLAAADRGRSPSRNSGDARGRSSSAERLDSRRHGALWDRHDPKENDVETSDHQGAGRMHEAEPSTRRGRSRDGSRRGPSETDDPAVSS